MIAIDGAQGEGGGQILRTSLTLSLCLGRAFRIDDIRKRRRKPGLARQHLTAVRAAARIGNARVEGAELGSTALIFEPGAVAGGEYAFDIGTAGSTSLVLQTTLLPLLGAECASRVELVGGTHNRMAPPFEFLELTFLPLLRRMGAEVAIRLDRPGFYPAGGGRMAVDIVSAERLEPLELTERGAIREVKATALLAHLPHHIAERELGVIGQGLGLDPDALAVARYDTAASPGNTVYVSVASDQVTEVFTGFGERGIPAETVAETVVDEVSDYLAAEVPVGRHLADQLLLPLALAGGGTFDTLEPSTHTSTNAQIIRRFIDVEIELAELGGGAWRIRVAH